MKYLLIGLLLFTSVPSFSQAGNTTVFIPTKGRPARVLNWDSRSILLLSDNFFLETKDSIIAQIGEQEFNEMKDKCSNSGWPVGLYKSGLSDEEDRAFDASLNKLKMYQVAAYTHIYNGKIFERHVILRVPYRENKDWDAAVQWEGNIYFLLKETDVELL